MYYFTMDSKLNYSFSLLYNQEIKPVVERDIKNNKKNRV